MNQPPPDHIEKMDWRINNLTWTTAPFTASGSSAPVPAGSPVTQAALIHYGKQRIGITIPNATALFLGLSEQYHVEAQHWIGKCIAAKDKFGKLPDHEAFTFFERIMASVVFACTALEAFVNEEIPDTYVHVVSRVIHMKTKDRDFRGEDGSSIWNALLSEPLPETHTTAKTMMKHFLDAKGKPPRWFTKCPF